MIDMNDRNDANGPPEISLCLDDDNLLADTLDVDDDAIQSPFLLANRKQQTPLFDVTPKQLA